MDTYKDRIFERKRVRERRRAQVKKGTANVPMEPWNRDDEQFDMRTHLAVTSQRKENNERRHGSEVAGEEQPDKLRKTVRFEQEASSASASSDPTVTLESPASGETQSRPGSVFLRWMHSTGRMDEGVVTSDKCWSGIEQRMPEISKELNWLRSGHVSMFSRRKICKFNPKILMEEKSWRTWKSNQNNRDG